jgi:NADPH:quinone reductase-like Zn-dependent oxidoreductase
MSQASEALSSGVSFPPSTSWLLALIQGLFKVNGVFSQFVVTDAEYGILPIPEGWSFEEAAQLGVTPLTALQCLHETLDLPSPFEVESGRKRTLLIWGGASSIGQYAIQFAKLGGLHVITTASPKNFDLLKALGADEVFDYRDENVVEKIRAATGNALDMAFDTISQGETQKQVTSAIGNEGGKVAAILPYENARSDVRVVFSNLPNLLKPVRFMWTRSHQLWTHNFPGIKGQVVH